MESLQSSGYVDSKHRLTGARQIVSPNCDARPTGHDCSMVVLHCISLPKGNFGTGLPLDLFLNRIDFDQHPQLEELRDLKVSSHLLILRDGEVIQLVPFDKRAWHAGVSSWQSQSNCNDYSIGIELEGTDDTKFHEKQYVALSGVLSALFRKYSLLSLSRLVAHSEVASGRKTDPGAQFDWRRVYRDLLTNISTD